jgi:hypothetical protein
LFEPCQENKEFKILLGILGAPNWLYPMKSSRQSKKSIPVAASKSIVQMRPFAPVSEADAQLDVSRMGHSLARMNVSPSAPVAVVQPKLTIGQPGDRYEQEADQMAAKVVNQIHAPQQAASSQTVQRDSVPEEEELQMKPSSIQRDSVPEEEELQMKPVVQRRLGEEEAAPDLESSIQQARGGGQALPNQVRTQMEQSFGSDFSGVKVHTDARSHQLNQSIQAKAFTTGKDIFFRQGNYDPGSRQGQELLAHELTHVVQQGGSQPLQAKAVQRSEAPTRTDSSYRLRRKISASSDRVVQRGIINSLKKLGGKLFSKKKVQEPEPEPETAPSVKMHLPGDAESFEKVMNNSQAKAFFRKFCTNEFTTDGIIFSDVLKAFKANGGEGADTIYNTFIKVGSPKEVNVSNKERDSIAAQLNAPTVDMFDKIHTSVRMGLMDQFSRFIYSPLALKAKAILEGQAIQDEKAAKAEALKRNLKSAGMW